jgi:hypothetical protein
VEGRVLSLLLSPIDVVLLLGPMAQVNFKDFEACIVGIDD